MMAMPVWVPAGRAGIDDIALPILLAPLLWAIPFFYACLAEDLVRCAAVISASRRWPRARSSRPGRWQAGGAR